MKRITSHPLFPLPKVYVPLVAGWINFAAQVVATGQAGRIQLAQLVATSGYSVIGYLAPNG
jgi:hypothetical protein